MFDYWLKEYRKKKEMNGKDARTNIGMLSGTCGLISNLFLFAIKLAAGWIAGSVSIMADAVNNLSDSASSVLTLAGFHIASKPPDKEHPYGHERSEYISGLIVSVIILLVGYEFLTSSINRVLNPSNLNTSALVFVLLIVSIFIKIIQGYFYKAAAKQTNSTAIQAASQDSFNDVYTTLVVLASALIERWTSWQIDGYAGILIALYIIYSGYQLIKGAINDLLGSRPDETKIIDISRVLDSYTSIIGYHDLLIHSYGPNRIFASVHIEIDDSWSLTEAHAVIDSIEKKSKSQLGIQLVCHLDPIAVQSKEHTDVYRKIKRILQSYQLNLKFHDFRIEEKDDQATLHFDVVVPDNVTKTNEELYESLVQDIQQKIGNFEAEIQFDRIYLLKNN